MVHNQSDASALQGRLLDRSATIGIIGLGYVGLPLVRNCLVAGFKVVGVDSDAEKIDALKFGRAYIRQEGPDLLTTAIAQERFQPTSNFASLANADAILICVPTPLKNGREPDLTHVTDTARSIAPHVRHRQLIVLESTTYPGTTREVVKPILEACAGTSGQDFFLAYSPERTDPGRVDSEMASIPKVVGADGKEALELACALYDQLAARTVPVSSLETAEASKLLENVFRAVNVALINELKMVYRELGVDIWEVIEAAKTKPFGFMPFYPGPGLGGHCIPIDPFYLSWKARQHGVTARLIEVAGEINTDMPRHLVDGVAAEVERRFASGLNGRKALILGLAYKKNTDDTRESPALKLIELFEERGARADYYDPYLPVIPRIDSYPHLQHRPSIAWGPETIASYEFVVIATDHDCVDYRALVAHAKLVFDTRNACERSGAKGENVIKL
jgi:UDP-N-acetyl-D-glucosamine dehydrogenase